MRLIASLSALLLALAPFLNGCTNASSHERSPESAVPVAKAAKKPIAVPDSLSVEPQTTHIVDKNISSRVSRVVSYSYLDIEDYEEDTFSRANTYQMMPDFSRFLWKYDPHPKVILTKKQTRRLLAIINSPATYRSIHSNCLSPRNCFCFYDDKEEIIGYYKVSFENGRVISVPGFDGSRSGTLSEKGKKKLRRFCRSAGINTR